MKKATETMDNVREALTKAQQYLDKACNEQVDSDALDAVLESLTSLTEVVSTLVDRLPEVQAVDAASDAQTAKDSA